MKFDYKAQELSEAKYVSGKYELKQIIESGKWAIFSSFHENGEKLYYPVDDDWGNGNIDNADLFQYRVDKAEEELGYLIADAKAEFGF